MEISDMTELNSTPVCLYCKIYAKIHTDYPINPAVFKVDTEVPRCQLHSQYTCNSCKKDYHFNGIIWCGECKIFSCIYCGGHQITEKKFLVYDYYYTVECTKCKSNISTLEYAEIIGMHPYQIGDIRPQGNLQLWVPLTQTIDYKPELKAWGNERLRQLTISINFEPVEEKSGHSKEIWDKNAEIWKNATREGEGDLNHLLIIIPKMLEFMDREAKQVMDLACGEGTFTRKVAEDGYQVTGTDVSNLVDYAIETENELQQGIKYQKVGIHDVKDHFEENSFDQVTCNMAIMDIDNLPLILENVKYILKPRGQFVFSITHPITAWPVVKTAKLPRDSQHNEDKGWLVDNYANEQPMLIHMPDMPAPMLYYPRKISTYVNNLVQSGFALTGLSEPVPEMETIKKYPRQMYQDYERNPIFMVFQTKLLR